MSDSGCVAKTYWQCKFYLNLRLKQTLTIVFASGLPFSPQMFTEGHGTKHRWIWTCWAHIRAVSHWCEQSITCVAEWNHQSLSEPAAVWVTLTCCYCSHLCLLHKCAQVPVKLYNSGCYKHIILYNLCLISHRLSHIASSLPIGWGFRSASALLLALLFVADLVLVFELQAPDIYLDVLADGCGVLAWLVHFGALLAFQRSIYRRTRGPAALPVLVVLSIPNLAFTLAVYIHHWLAIVNEMLCGVIV